jgi:hypothetical protein
LATARKKNSLKNPYLAWSGIPRKDDTASVLIGKNGTKGGPAVLYGDAVELAQAYG